MVSTKTFETTVESHHKAVILASNRLLSNAITQNREYAVERAKELNECCMALRGALDAKDQPVWLGELISKLTRFLSVHSQSGNDLLLWLSQNYVSMQEAVLSSRGINFDDDYVALCASRGIPEVFDSLVDALEKIILANVIDSRTVSEALDRLKAILKANRKGSFGSVVGVFDFARCFKSMLRGYATKIGGPAIEAFLEELEKAEKTVQKVNIEFQSESVRKLIDEKGIQRILNDESFDDTEFKTLPIAGLITREPQEESDSGSDDESLEA